MVFGVAALSVASFDRLDRLRRGGGLYTLVVHVRSCESPIYVSKGTSGQ